MRCDYTFDTREEELRGEFMSLVHRLRADTVGSVRVKQLNLSDIIVEPQEQGGGGGPAVLVERKRVDDFMASLFDGRLTEQLRRLRGVALEEHVRCALIVEGVATPSAFHGVDADTRMSRYRLFLKTLVGLAGDQSPGAPVVLRTTALVETAHVLITIQRTLASASSAGGGAVPPLPTRRTGTAFTQQLCATRGVSERRARVLADTFRHAHAFVEAWGRDAQGTYDRLVAALDGGRVVAARLLEDWGLGAAPTERGQKRRPSRAPPLAVTARRRQRCDRPQKRQEPVRDEETQQQLEDRGAHCALVHVPHKDGRGNHADDEPNDLPAPQGLAGAGVLVAVPDPTVDQEVLVQLHEVVDMGCYNCDRGDDPYGPHTLGS